MKVKEALVWISVLAVLMSGCSSVLAHPDLDVTGFTEIVQYMPNETVTLRTVIVNDVNDTVNATNSFICIPWGTEPLYSNVSTAESTLFPNAAQAHAYQFDWYRGVSAVLFFHDFTMNASETKELIYTLKINDWTGQCPTGDTWHQSPYMQWKTSDDDVFIDTVQSSMQVDNTSASKRFYPREGTFGELSEIQRFRITSSMLPNEYGAFPNVTQIYKDDTKRVNVSVFNGSILGVVITNATVSIEGCGVQENISIYPYTFEITPNQYGKIRIVANWADNSTGTETEMRGEGFISVAKQGGLVNWSGVRENITSIVLPDNSAIITVNASNTEGKEYIDKLLLTYSPSDRPWAVQLTMEENSDEYVATIEAFEPGRVVNYTIIGFDIAGLWEELVNESFGIPAVYLRAEPSLIEPGNVSIITAQVMEGSTSVANVSVDFETDFGVFVETWNDTHTNTTNESGIAIAHFSADTEGTATITATDPTGVFDTTDVNVALPRTVVVWAEPSTIEPGGQSEILAEVTADGVPRAGITVTFETDIGTFMESRSAIWTNTTNENGIAIAHFNPDTEGTATITVTEPNGAFNTTTVKVIFTYEFDTGEGDDPSIPGTHNGTITPSHKVIANKLYTYPCAGTGGHSEYMWIGNLSWNVSATWEGYTGDWHNLTFNETFELNEGETYNFSIRTGSYPQMHHNTSLTVPDGEITCTEFTDANGKTYTDWIPAIRLFLYSKG